MKKNLLLLVIVLLLVSVVEASASGTFTLANTVDVADQELQAGGTMGTVLCNVLAFVTGTIGKTLASFTIIGVGLGFFSGKVSWGAMIGVTLGISALFGSPAIIRAIAGGGEICGRK
ncbi:MAG: TrbC/VirB2 family protein [Rickettsiales bacterium]|jgi:type IV secretory pathway VirB2 component (pilin)|nr:TrbC/VirB2 family protein [Rickettsiales bacterium]